MSLGTFLLVDDSDDQRELLAWHLGKAGRPVLQAADADEGLRMLEAAGDEIGVVVIDLMMPGTDGWQLADAVRAAAPRVLVVIASVLDAHDYPAADAVLPKPFGGANVNRLIAELESRGPE